MNYKELIKELFITVFPKLPYNDYKLNVHYDDTSNLIDVVSLDILVYNHCDINPRTLVLGSYGNTAPEQVWQLFYYKILKEALDTETIVNKFLTNETFRYKFLYGIERDSELQLAESITKKDWEIERLEYKLKLKNLKEETNE